MKIDLDKLKEYLKAIYEDYISHSQLSDLIKISRLIIQSYLITYRKNVIILLQRNGITITDLAYDCIADAFSRHSNNKFYVINKFLLSLNENINTINNTQLFLAYKSFLIKVAIAQVSRLYAQTDPIGAKILRNIKDTVRSSDKFFLTKDYSGLKINLLNYVNEDSKPDYPLDKLLLNYNHFPGEANTISLLDKLHDCMSNQSEYRKSVKLFDIVILFKNYFHAQHDFSYEINESTLLLNIDKNEMESFELAQIQQKVEDYVKEKIMLNYFIKGKLNKEESEAAYFTLRDIIFDWCSGISTKDSIYDYFTIHYKVTKEIYLTVYRTKLEYLIKLTRDEFSNYLLKEI